jgi:hypothetical protein
MTQEQQQFENNLVVQRLDGNARRLGRKNPETVTVSPDQGPPIHKSSSKGVIYYDKLNPDEADIGEWDFRTNSGQIYEPPS